MVGMVFFCKAEIETQRTNVWIPRGEGGVGAIRRLGLTYIVDRVWLFVTPWIAACQAPLSSAVSWDLLRFTFIELVMLSHHLILCRPLLLLPSVFLSTRVFSSELTLCNRCPKYWSFSFSISPFNEYSGLISFRIDWLDLFAVQGTLKSLLQHHHLKASILQCAAFFMVPHSHYTRLLEKP